MLAHGGVAGGAAEALFIVVPIVIFALLSRKSRLRREREDAAAADADGNPATPS